MIENTIFRGAIFIYKKSSDKKKQYVYKIKQSWSAIPDYKKFNVHAHMYGCTLSINTTVVSFITYKNAKKGERNK